MAAQQFSQKERGLLETAMMRAAEIGDEVSIDDRASREELGYTGELRMEELA